MARGTLIAANIGAIILAAAAFYVLAERQHAEREALRHAAVDLTPACRAKLDRYGLAASDVYRSPYLKQPVTARGYGEADVRAIQRGCNIVDDMQGELAATGDRERWNAKRFSRSHTASCDHCHQSLGDKQDAEGNRLVGSNSLAASWVMADMYDRFTGLLLPYELRQMQCYINSSNGFKPNAADDPLRDVTAYTRFLSAAVDLKIGNRYPEQGIDEIPVSATLRRGDDYVRGAHLYRENCARCHGPQGFGTTAGGKTVFPALAGPNSFSLDSRMNFARVNSVIPGFICRNMPPNEEGRLSNQDCRDIGYYISTLPRPAGDKQGPLAAAWQQLMMTVMPPLTGYADALGNSHVQPLDNDAAN